MPRRGARRCHRDAPGRSDSAPAPPLGRATVNAPEDPCRDPSPASPESRAARAPTDVRRRPAGTARWPRVGGPPRAGGAEETAERRRAPEATESSQPPERVGRRSQGRTPAIPAPPALVAKASDRPPTDREARDRCGGMRGRPAGSALQPGSPSRQRAPRDRDQGASSRTRRRVRSTPEMPRAPKTARPTTPRSPTSPNPPDEPHTGPEPIPEHGRENAREHPESQ